MDLGNVTVGRIVLIRVVYEGISKSSWTESRSKYMSTYIIGHWCQLKSSLYPHLCNGFSISATAIHTAYSVYLGSDVEHSRLVPKFQVTKGSNQDNKECRGGAGNLVSSISELLHWQSILCQCIVIVSQPSWFHRYCQHWWWTFSFRNCKTFW